MTFKITFIHPITGKTETALDCTSDKMNADRTKYILNSAFNDCEIVNICEMSAEYHAAKDAYFTKYGTENE